MDHYEVNQCHCRCSPFSSQIDNHERCFDRPIYGFLGLCHGQTTEISWCLNVYFQHLSIRLFCYSFAGLASFVISLLSIPHLDALLLVYLGHGLMEETPRVRYFGWVHKSRVRTWAHWRLYGYIDMFFHWLLSMILFLLRGWNSIGTWVVLCVYEFCGKSFRDRKCRVVGLPS